MKAFDLQVTGSLVVTGSIKTTDGTFILSGSDSNASSSFSSRITTNESNMTLATASIAALTASISRIDTEIDTNAANITLATASIAAITASLGQPVNTNSNVTFNDINSTGTITATEIHTTFVSSSIAVASGSNIFGDELSDHHSFTGSVSISGSSSDTSLISYGKVGIGTTSPQSLLQVATSNGTTSHFGGIGTSNTHYSGISLGYSESGNANYRKTMIVQEQIGDGAARGHLHFLVDIANDGNSAVLDDSKMTIHGTNGHVGIGTTTPSTATNVLLSVGDTSLGYAGMEFIAGTNAESWRLYTSYNDDSEAVWGLYRVADATYKFLVHENGAMGIGTGSPSGNLQVEGSNGAQLKLSSAKTSIGGTDPLGVIEFVGNDSSSGRSGTMARIYAFINRPTDTHTTNIDGSANEGTSLSFQTGIDTSGNTSMTVSEKMRLDKAGNLGIGAVSFGPRLYSIVDNDEFAAYFTSDSSSGSTASVAIRADSSSGDRKLVSFFNGGSNIANITYNGSTATYGTGSDRRLKTNIIDFKDGLSILNKVEVKKFDWITGRKQDVGIVAQDLYNTIPKVIIKGDDNETDIEQPWQVDYPRLVPYLINAVQELSEKIDSQQKEIEELKK
jgi:hypothetical protein